MKKIIKFIISKIKNSLKQFLYFTGFLKTTLFEILNFFFHLRKTNLTVLLRQILFTGYEALGIISLIGLAIGGTIIIQGMSLLTNFGQTDYVYDILIIIITKELGPLLTAFILIARSGSSISTELGNMVVNHEIEALISFGIYPIRYLVVPRILGLVISIFCLTIYFNIMGLFGGYLVSSLFQSLSISDFFSNLLMKLTLTDLFVSQFKSLVFGFIIAIIACYYGLQVKFASTEVPIQTIKTVVSSITWILISGAIITILTYTVL